MYAFMESVGCWDAYHVHSGPQDMTEWIAFKFLIVAFLLERCEGQQEDQWEEGVSVVNADKTSRITLEVLLNNPRRGHAAVRIMAQGTAYVHMLDLIKSFTDRHMQVEQTLTKCPGKGCFVLVNANDPLKSVSRCGRCGHRYDDRGGGGDNDVIEDGVICLTPSWLAREEYTDPLVSYCFGKFANGNNLLFVFADDDRERYFYKELQVFVSAGVITLKKEEVLRPPRCRIGLLETMVRHATRRVWNGRPVIVWLSLRKMMSRLTTTTEKETNLITCQNRHVTAHNFGRVVQYSGDTRLCVLTAADGGPFDVPCMYFESNVVTEEMRTALAKALIDTSHFSDRGEEARVRFCVKAYARGGLAVQSSLVFKTWYQNKLCYDDLKPQVMQVLKSSWYAFLARTTNDHKITRSKAGNHTLLNEDVLSVILSHLVQSK